MAYWLRHNSYLVIVLCMQCMLCDIEYDENGLAIFYKKDDPVHVVDGESFYTDVLHSDRISVVKFYAHWCGHSYYFVPHYIRFANDTRLWHANILHVAILDCAVDENLKICHANSANEYPLFYFYPAWTESIKGHKELTEDDRSEQFMRVCINLLEKQIDKPDKWPDLSTYSSSLQKMFDGYESMKYMILILEPSGSYLGRKLILDLNNFKDDLIVRRVTPTTNVRLYVQMNANKMHTYVFLMENLKTTVKYTRIERFVEEQDNSTQYNEVDETVFLHEHGIEQNTRYDYLKILFQFIRFNKITPDHDDIDL